MAQTRVAGQGRKAGVVAQPLRQPRKFLDFAKFGAKQRWHNVRWPAVKVARAQTHPNMNAKLTAMVFLSVAFLGGSACAQTAPAPASAAATPSVAPSTALTPNQTIYTPRLPTVTELTNIAVAQGLTVERIEQTASQITVVYKNTSGQTNIVAYLPLPGAAGATATVVTPASPAPSVVYAPAPRVIYYRDYYGPDYSYPGYWYPPVSIGLGFGFRSGGFHGGHHYQGGVGIHHRR